MMYLPKGRVHFVRQNAHLHILRTVTKPNAGQVELSNEAKRSDFSMVVCCHCTTAGWVRGYIHQALQLAEIDLEELKLFLLHTCKICDRHER